ncbi:hypothetical protein ISN45_Aa06g018530 [Arabidopsis thaliana x Arabidopsis arenosa]|uniref:DUF3444 domain-containing protein n=1 Tax=Arabidopsis thaliana x Arabidopsis arenosa TaxID=1240361 RepID=A0A8T1YXC9_9BRAS|nr:hypothetical protein ISN45_Aa06g018530 [Arabidopsis thaliana x Arabidopsis arenosa]
MDDTVNELLRRKKAVLNHQIRIDLVVSNHQEKPQAFSLLQQKDVPAKSPGIHFCGKECSFGLSNCAVKVGEKRQWNECGDICSTENRSKSEDAVVNLSKDRIVHSKRRVFSDNGDAAEEFGSGKQLTEVDCSKNPMSNAINTNRKMDRKQDAQVGAAVGISGNLEVDQNSGLCDSGSGGAVPQKIFGCAGLKFNDFDKLREEVNFEVGQTWAVYDTVDGMPRLYAQIRKVLAPCFELRITYLEPDPNGEKELQWFEEDLPVSVGMFRLGENKSTQDRSIFSHVIHCNERSNTLCFSVTCRFIKTCHFSVSPRKGETWALFKNWDIKWSSEPDSHRKYEYEFVEILSDYSDEGGVYVAYLHKAKGFASVFFRMGTGYEGIFRILPQSLYRFSHRVPSFKLTGIEGKGMPKDAYELDKAALPETIEEIIVPSNSESNIKPKRQATYFVSKGKVFQTGQIWSFYSGYDDLPLYYGRIQKITFTHAFKQDPVIKLHIGRLKATRSPKDVVDWEDGQMPVGCGTFYSRKVLEIITPNEVSHQIVPQTSLDGIEYTILPKIGEVWVIYRYWSSHIDVEDLEFGLYDMVEILDDTLDYKVQLLEYESVHDDDDGNGNRLFRACTEYTYNEDEGSEPIFTIPKSERIRFSNKVRASRVTKEMLGELKEFLSVDYRATPINVIHC